MNKEVTLSIPEYIYRWYAVYAEFDTNATHARMEQALETYMLEVEALLDMYDKGIEDVNSSPQ